METMHAEVAWLGQVERDVAIDIEDGVIVDIRSSVAPGPGEQRLSGFAIPGLVNEHSHAFHRALRGRTHEGTGNFWTWRDAMYSVAGRLDPELYLELARATYAEMALAGITHVHEFHYLHHDPDGTRYTDPNVMAHALERAAAEAGIRLTLLDTCYLHAGLRGEEMTPVQRRFADAGVDDWTRRVGELALEGDASVGVAIHSVRAVDPHAMSVVAGVADDLDVPLHVHVSEQSKENEECMAVHRMSPTELLGHSGVLGPRTTAIHATHVTPMDVELLAASRTRVCMCPTTERDLGDGIGPTSAFRSANVPISFGSDSHAVIDIFEEARTAELHERLVTHERAMSPVAFLFDALVGGRKLEPGMPADLVTVATDSPRMSGGGDEDLPARVVFAATSADVRDVIVGGREVVRGGRHVSIDDVGAALDAAMTKLTA